MIRIDDYAEYYAKVFLVLTVLNPFTLIGFTGIILTAIIISIARTAYDVFLSRKVSKVFLRIRNKFKKNKNERMAKK